VLYLAADIACAFIETFGQATGENLVTVAALEERVVSRVIVRQPLSLVDLTGVGLAQLGADGRLCTGDHALAQRWASALWAHPQRPDGVLYRARHDPSRLCAALFDHLRDNLDAIRLGRAIDYPRLDELLATYRFGLDEQERSDQRFSTGP
jgi:hypothetical protein